MANVEVFRNNLLRAGVVDPEGVHHEFVSLVHGQKIDFDAIPEGSDLLAEWEDVVAETVDNQFPTKKYPRGIVLLGIANGTNRLVAPVANKAGERFTPAHTKKVGSKIVELTDEAKRTIRELNPSLILGCEDVGTTGFTSATAVMSARSLVQSLRMDTEIRIINTWQRSELLPELRALQVPYSSIIFEPMPAYEPETCRESGFCADGWELVLHG